MNPSTQNSKRFTYKAEDTLFKQVYDSPKWLIRMMHAKNAN